VTIALILMLTACASAAQAATEAILDITPIYQTDYTDTLFEYRGEEKSVATSGCGAVCLAMAMNWLGETDEYDPEALLLEAFQNGLYTGVGLGFDAMIALLESHGYEGEWFQGSAKLFRRALRHGCPVIAFMGEGFFTNKGHYILIVGIDKYDRLLVVDPNSERKSQGRYPSNIIVREADSDGSFLVCYRTGETPLALVTD
jgi:hypothetical protein